MTAGERAERLRQVARALRGTRIVFLAATGTMVVMQARIWDRGEMTNGAKLTYKDNRPYYGYQPPAPRKVSGKGKDGAKIKGGYYANYTAFKTSQGRGDNPYELTGSLRQAWLGGATPTPVELSITHVVITLDRKNKKKADGLTERKGVFLAPNADEEKGHHERMRRIYRSEVLGKS
jgi:hypothetical protein